MKISLITKAVSISLLIILVGFSLTVTWSLRHLNQAFASVEFFTQQKDRFYADISQPVFLYLANGDATLLAAIDRNVQQISQQIAADTTLSDVMKVPFGAVLEQVRQSIVVELTSAGKLADPQILLINNEQQMSRQLQSLLDYVTEAQSAAQAEKQRYWQLIAKTQGTLLNLSRARQSFFAANGAISPEILKRQHQQLLDLQDDWQQLPLLGVMKDSGQEQSDFEFRSSSANQAQAEDQAQEPIGEIQTLMQRYGKELENAQQLAQQKNAARSKVSSQMQILLQQLKQLEAQITRDYQFYESSLYGIVAICVLLLALISSLMIVIKSHLAKIISQICIYIDKLANGDLRSSFDTQSRIAEIKHLEQSLAQLHDYFNLLIRDVNHESSVLNNYWQTILLVAQSLESIIAEQQHATEQAAQQMNQLSASFKDVAQNAAESQAATTLARQLIDQGLQQMQGTHLQVNTLTQVMNETAQALRLLQQDAKAIEGVLSVIQGFTEQTNLLALNAAIEAARAGEHGRGFAVVADEVRKLASHTAESADQIQALVEKLNQATRTTVGLMSSQQASADKTTLAVEQVFQAFGGIKDSVNDIFTQSHKIAETSRQQSQVTEQIAQNFVHTAELAKQTTREAQNNKLSATAIAEVNLNLQKLIAQFKVT